MLDDAISAVDEPFAYGIDLLEQRRRSPIRSTDRDDTHATRLIEPEVAWLESVTLASRCETIAYF